MATNAEVRMTATGEYVEFPGRQEFIIRIGAYGSDATFYVSREQMKRFIAEMHKAIAQADSDEYAFYAREEA